MKSVIKTEIGELVMANAYANQVDLMCGMECKTASWMNKCAVQEHLWLLGWAYHMLRFNEADKRAMVHHPDLYMGMVGKLRKDWQFRTFVENDKPVLKSVGITLEVIIEAMKRSAEEITHEGSS